MLKTKRKGKKRKDEIEEKRFGLCCSFMTVIDIWCRGGRDPAQWRQPRLHTVYFFKNCSHPYGVLPLFILLPFLLFFPTLINAVLFI